jgi:hypothetical protein
MGMFDHWHEDTYCFNCLGRDQLTAKEARDALKDLNGLFQYLAVHGFNTPIPSIVRLVDHLTKRAGLPPAK